LDEAQGDKDAYQTQFNSAAANYAKELQDIRSELVVQLEAQVDLLMKTHATKVRDLRDQVVVISQLQAVQEKLTLSEKALSERNASQEEVHREELEASTVIHELEVEDLRDKLHAALNQNESRWEELSHYVPENLRFELDAALNEKELVQEQLDSLREKHADDVKSLRDE
ncbi:hypothetical protein OF83DRAFT_1089825, partial [Amylostereum chailletii]